MGTSRATRLFMTTVVAALVASGYVITAQTKATSSRLRTPFGHPDLEGIWSFATLTPLERPAEFKDKAVLTEQEAQAFEQALLKRVDHDTNEGAELVCKGTGNYNEFWYDRGSKMAKTLRTSLIVDPADGKIPPLNAEGIRR